MSTVNGSGRRLRWILVASMAANVFLVGFIGAEAWRVVRRGGGLASTALTDVALPRILERLPPADGRLVGDAFARRLPELAELQRRAREAVERLRAEMARSPFDPEGVRAAMRELREARSRLSGVLEEILVDVLPRMSDEGRRILSEQRLLRR